MTTPDLTDIRSRAEAALEAGSSQGVRHDFRSGIGAEDVVWMCNEIDQARLDRREAAARLREAAAIIDLSMPTPTREMLVAQCRELADRLKRAA